MDVNSNKEVSVSVNSVKTSQALMLLPVPGNMPVLSLTEEELLQDLNDEVAMELLPVMVFIGLLVIMGVVGNGAVSYVFCFRLRMSTQNFLIVTLAVFDFLTSIFSMPLEIDVFRHFYTYDSDVQCRLLRFVQFYTSVASSLVLLVIGVDRLVIFLFVFR
jgi:hypothetical protein